MSRKKRNLTDKTVASLLNDASACGMDVHGLTEHLADYFANPTEPLAAGERGTPSSPRPSSDSESESDEFEEAGPGPAEPCESRDESGDESDWVDEAEEPMDLSSDNESVIRRPGPVIDDVEEEAAAATNLAQQIDLDLEPLKDRVNKCNCRIFNGRRCIEQFSVAEQESIRYSTKELTEFEKDLLLLGIISSSINDGNMTQGKKSKPMERKNTRMRNFCYGQKRICRYTFFYLMEIGPQKFTNLKKWYASNGLIPRRKKSGGRRGKKLLKLEQVEAVVKFILNFTAEHCIHLPGRIPGFKSADVKLLPSYVTKAHLWRIYRDAAPEHGPVAESTFRKLWSDLLSYVVVAKPATDLCWTCQQNNNLITRQVNVPDEEKTEALRRQEEHLLEAQRERDAYRTACQASKAVAREHSIKKLGKNAANSKPVVFHYSFDFAQQVHYPADPQQPGPSYFRTQRKCHIFGMAAEGLPAQVNYLADEGVSCGKGANVVVSYIHHFLENYGIGEQHVHFNADNCAGQNKNNTMLQYLCWRVESNLHKSVSISFLPVGHTKFAPDWCFGLLKQRYRKTKVSCLQDIVNVVDSSTVSGVNIPQLVGNEKGDVFVKVYDWSNHLGKHFKRFPRITFARHFRVTEDHPGRVFYKEKSDSAEEMFDLARSSPPPTLPPLIQPAGLDASRRKYLYEQIREFCTPETRDLVCPAPE
ncbi:uncharacterized protein LOC105437692 [Strongylocentrotus purpuratus]|uniref:DUF7869 domain-containing protein n=1 Tax=Strongylocentrotus purpuratus TaxID=7668 RepID=A0A7M7HIS3_STRPU|nr:uncharacterized protein LOC105437692 [Strongylocentrotus purpuratus]